MARVTQKVGEIRILGITFPIRRYGDERFVSWYYHGSQRRRVTRTSEQALRAVLEDAAVRINNGQVDVNDLRGNEARAMVAARDAIAPYHLPIDVVAREYVAARELLGAISIVDAARFYQRHAGEGLRDRTVSAVVADFLVAKSDLSEQYRGQLRKDLARFAATFGARLISEIDSSEMTTWVHEAGRVTKTGKKVIAGAARRNQVRNTLVTLFNFARDNQHLIRGRSTEAELVKKLKHVRGEIQILSPSDLRLLLELTDQLDRRWLPFMVFASMAGIRTITLQRLEWIVVKWAEAVLQVPAAKSKISRRYLPPLLPAAAAWVADWKGERGPITPEANPRYFLQRLARRAGWARWPKNILRKSFISYRMAMLKSAAAVALEANTSEHEIFENYRSVCTKAGDSITAQMAEEYFGVMPVKASNLVPFQSHLAL